MTGRSRSFIGKLRRPLPELWGLVAGTVLSSLWRPHLGSAGVRFFVSHGTRIMGASAVFIGDDFHGGPGLWIEAVRRYRSQVFEPCIRIGNGVSCSDLVHLAANHELIIGDHVMFGSKVHVTDHAHGRYQGDLQDSPMDPPAARRLSPGLPVRIGARAWIGDGVVVLPGSNIGEGTIVGANSVVRGSLPANAIAVGSPARVVKTYDGATGRWVRVGATA